MDFFFGGIFGTIKFYCASNGGAYCASNGEATEHHMHRLLLNIKWQRC